MIHKHRRFTLGQAAVIAVSLGLAITAARPAPDAVAAEARVTHTGRPQTYVVSDVAGTLPEGISEVTHNDFYVTSSGDGAVYRGSTHDVRMTVFAAAGDGGRTEARGVHVDRTGRVLVVGIDGVDVYSPSGALLDHLDAPPGAVGPASLNDLAVAKDAIYVTDFANPVVLRAARTRDGFGPLLPWRDLSDIEPRLPAAYWFLNGIAVSDDQHTLLVSSQGLEALVRVDLRTKAAQAVDLGTTSFAADGIVLRGHRVYAVLNYDPPDGRQGVYVAELDPDLRHGRITASNTQGLDSPTAVAVDGDRLLVVDSQLDSAPGTPPYTVTAIDRPR